MPEEVSCYGGTTKVTAACSRSTHVAAWAAVMWLSCAMQLVGNTNSVHLFLHTNSIKPKELVLYFATASMLRVGGGQMIGIYPGIQAISYCEVLMCHGDGFHFCFRPESPEDGAGT